MFGLSLRSRWLPALFLLCAGALDAFEGWRDPEFDKVPFAQWAAGGAQTSIHWSEHVLPVLLSVHQRLLARFQIQLDGVEAARRRGEGEFVFYFQLTDSAGKIYQDHTTYDLAKVEEGMKAQDLVCTESAFVLPGDYTLVVAIYDTATHEHAVKRDKLHVLPLRSDPLPEAWRQLPPVEFVEASEAPDHWFLPKIHGRLHLPVNTHRPVRIEAIVNVSPTEMTARGYGVQDRNFSFLIPSLKVVSQMTGQGLTIDVSMVDISRRKVIYRQEDVHELDWEDIKASLTKANSASIDVKSLADRHHNAAFFLQEVGRLMQPKSSRSEASSADRKPEPRAVMVLSGPMAFDAPQEVEGQALQPVPDARVFYIRMQQSANAPLMYTPMRNRRPTYGGLPGGRRRGEDAGFPGVMQMDQLEPMLKSVDPRLFDVQSADQFRKALATLIGELSAL